MESFEKGLRESDPVIGNAQLYAWACLRERVPFANGAPHLAVDFPAAQALAREMGVPVVALVLASLPEPSARDPQEIVVDETAGCLVALVCVPFELPWVAAAFVLFRLLDIFKPGPIRWIDRHVEGSLGVMGDDLAAGAIAGAGLWIAHAVLS